MKTCVSVAVLFIVVIIATKEAEGSYFIDQIRQNIVTQAIREQEKKICENEHKKNEHVCDEPSYYNFLLNPKKYFPEWLEKPSPPKNGWSKRLRWSSQLERPTEDEWNGDVYRNTESNYYKQWWNDDSYQGRNKDPTYFWSSDKDSDYINPWDKWGSDDHPAAKTRLSRQTHQKNSPWRSGRRIRYDDW